MEIIRKLSDYIEEEITDAGKYAACAIEFKDERPELADLFFNLAEEELGHMERLHAAVVTIIDEYRRTKGNPPEAMQAVYDYVHKKEIERTAEVKAKLSLYGFLT